MQRPFQQFDQMPEASASGPQSAGTMAPDGGTSLNADLPAATTATDSAGSESTSYFQAVSDWIVEHTSVDWILAQVDRYGWNLLAAIVVFVVGRWTARLVTRAMVRAARKARVDETLVGFLDNLIYMILLTVVSISALTRLGIDPNGLTAVLAAMGFAIGMALQGSLGNLAAGIMLVFFKPFRVGDVVEVAGNRGTVVEIQIFNTILLTLDNVRIIVPNNKITDSTIENYSAEPERRIDMIVGCGYNDDLREVKAALIQILDQHPEVLQSPAPQVAVWELGSSSVDFTVRPWVRSSRYWDVKFELTEQIKLMFDENGFTIPFPSQDLFLHRPEQDSPGIPTANANDSGPELRKAA